MSFQNAVLGLVIEKPSYGYELAQRFDARIGGAWAYSTDAAIYSVLKAFERKGQVLAHQSTPPDGAPWYRRSKWYEATDLGREEFEEWMLAPASPLALRDDMHIKIALATVEQLPGLIKLTEQQEQECLNRIDGLRKACGELDDDVYDLLDEQSQAEWRVEGAAWVRRSSVALLALQVSQLQEVRVLMKKKLRRLGLPADGG